LGAGTGFSGFTGYALSLTELPLPGVAVIDGTPWVIVSDRLHDVVGYHLLPGGTGFVERFRTPDPRRMMGSPPTILADGKSVVGTCETEGAVVFSGPSAAPAKPVSLGCVLAAPTRLRDDRFAVVLANGGFAVLRHTSQGYGYLQKIALAGQSIASAAASRTHLFISTTSALYTYDASNMQEVLKFNWVGGGLWPLAIGPQGHVYAMASNVLFVFPAPAQRELPRIQDRILEPR
jgi:hypothetical protein